MWSPRRHVPCHMGPLRAQAIGHVHGTKHRAWHPSSREPTVASQDLTVAPLEQTAAHAGEKSRAMFDICSWANAYASSFMYVELRSCAV